MTNVVISGTGFYAPPEVITNEELVEVYNRYVQRYNEQHAKEIAAGKLSALLASSAEFIEKASGIKRRHVINKSGILDINRMMPIVPERPNEQMSVQCEFSLVAVKEALMRAKKTAADIDAVIVSCTNTQRPYPGIAVELQEALGIKGYAFDMRVACSSVTFGLQTAMNAVAAGNARAVLVVTPEIATTQMNFRDRDSHFIFGDAATAAVVESVDTCDALHPYEIISAKLFTQFSNNIRANHGFLNRVESNPDFTVDKLFVQNGRTVFKEVVPLVAKLIVEHLHEHRLEPEQIKRFWLHQANINMNKLIVQKILGGEPTHVEAPIILDEYANTGSAGSLIAFHLFHTDLHSGDLGVLCSFGAGYSIGNLILKRL